jgi:hypothetical protein
MRRYSAHIIALMTFILCGALSCKTSKVVKNAPFFLNKEKSIVICDSVKAAELIITDTTDDIFGKMTVTDMVIQLKKNYSSDYTTADIASDYFTFIQKDVTNSISSGLKLVTSF